MSQWLGGSARGCEAARQRSIPRDRNAGVAPGAEACVWMYICVCGDVCALVWRILRLLGQPRLC